MAVEWRPLTPLAAHWEMALQDAVSVCVEAGGSIRLIEPGAEQPADLLVMAYQATAHADIAASDSIQDVMRGRTHVESMRVALVACDLALPQVTLDQVRDLLSEHLPRILNRHPFRAEEAQDLLNASIDWGWITMRRLGISQLARPSAIRNDEFLAEAGDGSWNHFIT